MPTCLLCKKDVTSGYVVCGNCAEKMKPNTMQPVLYGFASWLGSELAQNDTVNFCTLCKGENCNDTSVCRKGITAWFRARADEFMETAGYDGILGRLKTVCPFSEVFEDIDDSDDLGKGSPRRKIGHIRADYDKFRWWNTVWACHWDLFTEAGKAEMDRTYEALTAKDALYNLNALRRFCWSHPEAQTSPEADEEFNFFLVGETCDFWVRLITREKDYNMYLNAYAKAETGQGAV